MAYFAFFVVIGLVLRGIAILVTTSVFTIRPVEEAKTIARVPETHHLTVSRGDKKPDMPVVSVVTKQRFG